MPFIPHTQDDVSRMLAALNLDSVQQLFDEVPENLLVRELNIPEGVTEMTLLREMKQRAEANFSGAMYLGAGAYEHHIPAAVWDVVSRGEFMTAYTPYQAEASQGTLQLVYEYQSMMTALMAMDVSNASLYDGASALSEAILMAVRASKRRSGHSVLVAGTLNPRYTRAARAIVETQGIDVQVLDFDHARLTLDEASLSAWEGRDDLTALVIPMPNFFGRIEEVNRLTDWAHQRQITVIGVVNPIAVSYLLPPGQWGQKGADIVVGDGQPLGLPLASGGPYFGFMCCRQSLVRQMPGRIIGRTVDLEGRTGFTLTLQAREQHIRRAKATSNICTNQGLAVTAATIHMALLGGEGLQSVAKASMAGAEALKQKLARVSGVSIVGVGPGFHEFVVRLPREAGKVVLKMAEKGVLPGLDLGREYPLLRDCLLVCVTETKTLADLEQYVTVLEETLKECSAC
ncbi:MAG: aminomethyl-transferring glycine dehydrogenase subunit GcvPA [Hahellaceae bacterium]|nr:aminomethyl-transferring glycine dehydrogenase subunit GcvPA [Hahellaceae bacterium]